MALSSSDYEVGLRLKAKDRTGKWYLASIVEIDKDDQDICVHFEGWSHRYDEWIDFDTDRLRPLTPTTAQQFQPDLWKPKVGEHVRAKWTNKRLYPGKITKISADGYYDIKFKDGWTMKVAYQDMRPAKKLHKPAVKLREPLEGDPASSDDEEDEEVVPTRRLRKKTDHSFRSDVSGTSSGGEKGGSGSSSQLQEEKPKPKPKKRAKRISSDSEDEESSNETKSPSSKKPEKPSPKKTPPTRNTPKAKTPLASTRSPPTKPPPAKVVHSKTGPPTNLQSSRSTRSSSMSPHSSGVSSPASNHGSPSSWTTKSAAKQIEKARQIVTRKRMQSPSQDAPERQKPTTPKPKILAKSNKKENQTAKDDGDSAKSAKKATLPQLSSKSEKKASKMLDMAKSPPRKSVRGDGGKSAAKGLSTDQTDKAEDLISLAKQKESSQHHSADVKEGNSPNLPHPAHSSVTVLEQVPTKPLVASSPTSLISPSLPIVVSGIFESGSNVTMTTATHVQSEHPLGLPSKSTTGGEQPVRREDELTASEYMVAQQPAQKLLSSAYDVALDSSEIEGRCLAVNPAVITIDPVQLAPEKHTRQQSRGYAECAPLPGVREEGERVREPANPSLKEKAVLSKQPNQQPRENGESDSGSNSDAGNIEVKRLKTTLVDSELPKSRLRSKPPQSSTDEQPRPTKRPRVMKTSLKPDQSDPPSVDGDDGKKETKVSIVNVKQFKRMTGLDLPDAAKKRGSLKGRKEVVIDLDHNQFKCKSKGCNKSFRKESLLLWHIKHYHPGMKISKNVPVVPGLVTRPRRSPLTSPSQRTHHDSSGQPKKVSIGKPRQESDKSTPSSPPRVPPGEAKGEREQVEEKKDVKEVKEVVSDNRSKLQPKAVQQGTSPLPPTSMVSGTPPLIGRKPPLGRPPKRPSSDTPTTSQPTSPSADGPPGKKPKQLTIVEVVTMQPEVAKGLSKHQGGVRKRAAASARQRWKEICEIEDQSEDSLDSFNASWQSGSTDSTSLMSLDIGFEMIEGESHRSGKPWHSPEQPPASSKTRVYNRYCSGPKDDVIHCVCGSFKEEGFMIQCDQCLSWQHGDCVEVDEEAPPEDYICYACSNPKGLRKQAKFKMDRAWFGQGKLLSSPGDPPFPHFLPVLRSHRLMEELAILQRAHHAVRLLLQIASDPTHPRLKMWSATDNDIVTKHLVALVTQALTHCSVLEDDMGGDSQHDQSPQNRLDQCAEQAVEEDNRADGNSPSTSSDTTTPSPMDHVSVVATSHDDHMDIGRREIEGEIKETIVDDVVSGTTSNEVSHDSHKDKVAVPKVEETKPKSSFPSLPPLRRPSPPVNTNADGLSVQKPLSLDPLPPPGEPFNFGMETATVGGDTDIACDISHGIPAHMVDTCEEENPVPIVVDTPPLAVIPVKVEEEKENDVKSTLVEARDFLDTLLVGSEPVVSGNIHCPIPVRSPVRTSFEPVATPLASTGTLPRAQQSPFKPLQSPSNTSESTAESKKQEVSDQTMNVNVFAESFVLSNSANWSSRMMLLEQVGAIHDKVLERLDAISKEIESLPVGSDPVITVKGCSRKNPLRKMIQELHHCLPTEQPKLVV